EVAVVVEAAVAVLVEQRRVVEVRVRRDGEGEDARLGLEADRVGIDRGRPDVGEDLAAGQLTARRRLAVAGPAGYGHVEDGDIALGADLRMHDVERGGGRLAGLAV